MIIMEVKKIVTLFIRKIYLPFKKSTTDEIMFLRIITLGFFPEIIHSTNCVLHQILLFGTLNEDYALKSLMHHHAFTHYFVSQQEQQGLES